MKGEHRKIAQIDSFLRYTIGIGAYLFFGDKSKKKNPDDPLDIDNMLQQMKGNDPIK